jgi:membrane-associated phospholipid phosphatase
MLSAAKTAGQNPLVGSRTAAIVQTAVYEAVNSIDGSYTPYLVDLPAPLWASKEAAVAQAAHDALLGLFPAQATVLDLELKSSLQGIPDGPAKAAGIRVGEAAAQLMLAVRADDGWDAVVDYVPGDKPGDWQPTPPNYGPPVAPQWPYVTPFALQSGSQFRPPPPPTVGSPEDRAALKQVRELGAIDSTVRTADQTEAALFWQGIVTPNLAAVENWNQIAQRVAVSQGNTLVQNARLFALLDLTEADAFIACWDAKYTYNFWRPVTALRYNVDPDWTPLMATPSHPSYPSAHSSISGSSAAVLASFFGHDDIPFSYSWVGLPGVTRSFASFSAATDEIGQSRIWAGFHYSFDITAGQGLGQSVGEYVFQNFLQPRTAAHAATGDASILSAMRAVPTGEGTGTNLGDDGRLPGTSGANLSAGGLTLDLRPASATSSSAVSDPAAPAAWHKYSAGTQPLSRDDNLDDLLGLAGSWDAILVSAPGMMVGA